MADQQDNHDARHVMCIPLRQRSADGRAGYPLGYCAVNFNCHHAANVLLTRGGNITRGRDALRIVKKTEQGRGIDCKFSGAEWELCHVQTGLFMEGNTFFGQTCSDERICPQGNDVLSTCLQHLHCVIELLDLLVAFARWPNFASQHRFPPRPTPDYHLRRASKVPWGDVLDRANSA